MRCSACPPPDLHEWPDRYIHTNFDGPNHIDPTKLKRAGFIGAASAWYLANISDSDVKDLWEFTQQQSLRRTAQMLERRKQLSNEEADNLTFHHWKYEREMVASITKFAPDASIIKNADRYFEQMKEISGPGKPIKFNSKDGTLIYHRNSNIKGPLSVFGYNYLSDHYGEENTRKISLLGYNGLHGSGGEYAYEALNFVNEERSILEIRNAVSAEFGPIPLEMVVEYLKALESIGIINIK